MRSVPPGAAIFDLRLAREVQRQIRVAQELATREPCPCCDLRVGCGRERMAEIRREDPIFAAYLDGVDPERNDDD